MRITRALIQQRMEAIELRYQLATGREIEHGNGYAQCCLVRLTDRETAYRLYGEWSALRDLLDA